MIFVEVPKHRRLVCSQCDSRNVRVMPIFPRFPRKSRETGVDYIEHG